MDDNSYQYTTREFFYKDHALDLYNLLLSFGWELDPDHSLNSRIELENLSESAEGLLYFRRAEAAHSTLITNEHAAIKAQIMMNKKAWLKVLGKRKIPFDVQTKLHILFTILSIPLSGYLFYITIKTLVHYGITSIADCILGAIPFAYFLFINYAFYLSIGIYETLRYDKALPEFYRIVASKQRYTNEKQTYLDALSKLSKLVPEKEVEKYLADVLTEQIVSTDLKVDEYQFISKKLLMQTNPQKTPSHS